MADTAGDTLQVPKGVRLKVSLPRVPSIIINPAVIDKEPPRPAVHAQEASVFCDTSGADWERGCIERLWAPFTNKLSKTPLEEASSLKDEIPHIVKRLSLFPSVDSPRVQALFDAFFEKAAAFDSARSAIADMPPDESHVRKAAEFRSRLEGAKATVTNESDELTVLKKRLKALNKARKDLQAMVELKKKSIESHQEEVTKLEVETAALSNNPSPTEEAKKRLEDLRTVLGTACEELKTFKIV